jgi:amino acid transporter
MELKQFAKNPFKRKVKDTDEPGFGTFSGVYIPGILSMFGVIIYLRFGWIVGSLGIIQTISVVSLSCFIVFVTVLSISSSATNMHVKGGGTYYMLSRSLGIEIGSAVGIPLFIAQALTISFCAMGFAESIHPLFPSVPISYLGAITLTALMGLVYTSSSITLKFQLVTFLVIGASFASLFMGKSIQIEEGMDVFTNTLSISFWTGFALFFPAATGVETGVSMSGSLKNPSKSIPIGSIAVIITAFIVYLFISLFLNAHAPRSCLVSDMFICQHIAKFEFLIIMGIWAAILSSIVGGLLASPRTLQALAADGVFPKFLAKNWGKDQEPRLATLVCFGIAMAGVFYGSVDALAPILTMFYLIAYATLNLATGLEGLLGNPSWRPTFQVHWAISLSGVALCLLAMFMINPGSTFIALALVMILYAFMRKRKFAKKWEDIQYGLLTFLSRFAIYKLAHKQSSARAWRPNFLVLSSNPMQVGHLLDVSSAISHGKGFLTVASIFSSNLLDHDRVERWKNMVNVSLKESKVDALIEFCTDDSLISGAKRLLLNYGMGSISPNTLVLGEMKNKDITKEYFEVIQLACEAKKNVIIVKGNHTSLKSNQVHLWWDDSSRPNSDMMLLLSHMLTSSKKHRKSKIQLNSIVPCENVKEQRLTYFNDFFAKGRLAVNPNIYIQEPDLSLSDVMCEKSKDADIVLMGMSAPSNFETLEEFENYYYTMTDDTNYIPNVVFVICAENLNVSEIFGPLNP